MPSTEGDATDAPSKPAPAEVRWHFGAFTVWESQRRIERAGQAVRVGPRSFDLLLQLLRRAGEFVSKDELLATVWAGVVVEEGSVRVHMSTLRKALGEPGDGEQFREWISNVPHRGYRFNGMVRQEVADGTLPTARTRPPAPSFTQLPVRLTELVGREADVDGVLASLVRHRLVTIVGAGGIGKTSVAIRAAAVHQLRQAATQIAFVDLAPLISQDHVVGTMARALGAAADMPDALHAIVQGLAGRDVLLLIDNCEHVLDSLAGPVTTLLTALPGLRILATSREPMRVTGEYVLRLSALAVPEEEDLALAQAMRWPAVQLLVERARAGGASAFNEAQGPLLARIARRLDGIPLAIELVAARLAAQSVRDLALRLDDHMRLHSVGSRNALPRHKTLAAALEWSIALLDENELRLFRRLSVFRGRFEVESALRINVDMDPDATFDALISLANKSLVSFDSSDAIAPYRLLDTTRSYGAALLEQSGERRPLLRRHALFMLDLMKAGTAELPDMTEQAWGERYGYRLDDLRFALEVCVAQEPDARTAAALVIASTPLWFHVSQVGEYGDRVAAVIALVDRQAEPDPETAAWLNCARVGALLHTAGPAPDLSAVAERALADALATKSRMLELQARWGHCTQDLFRGEYETAWRNGQALFAVVQSWDDPAAVTIAHRVLAMSGHFCGRLLPSRQHSETALRSGAGRLRANMFQVDGVVAAHGVLCRTLWLQGETTNAFDSAFEALARAESAGNSVTLCQALYGACAVALWSGELDLARKWVPLMMDEAQRRGLAGWHRYAEWFFEGLQLRIASDPGAHIREVSGRLAGYDTPRQEMLLTFCADWLDDGMAARVMRGDVQWSAAEAWRAIGHRNEAHGMEPDAESAYRQALEIARQQGAMAWELRAATSLATLWARLDRRQQAMQLLDATCERAPSDDRNTALARARTLRERLAAP